MRHGPQGRRQRNKGHQGGNAGFGNNGGARRGTYNRNQIFDSNGPEVRIRGTAHQVCEKYLALAKDAASTGDRVVAESYLQHAEHYQRIINTWSEEINIAPKQDGVYVPNGNQTPSSNEDDLSLPISILGGDVKSVSQNTEASVDENESMLQSA